MFSGIVEEAGIVTKIENEQGNMHITIRCSFTGELKIDQSIAHNGVCLTVVKKDNDEYTVTAIKETLEKSNLGTLKIGDWVNLERSMKIESLLDGHLVQGHVDQTAVCANIEEADGSWYYTFEYNPGLENITVEKGSIAVNGVSLTVVNSKDGSFRNAIIPYTYEHTNFCKLQKGSIVNLEFDIIGKYLTRLAKNYLK
jgi:riboflavin synthase